MTREKYLKSQWRPYPGILSTELRPGFSKCRWTSNLNSELQLGEFTTTGNFTSHTLSAKEVLVDGDILLISENHAQLLAPNLGNKTSEQLNLLKCNLLKWNGFLRSLRSFFDARGFLEVQTPTLVPTSGAETFLNPFMSDGHYLPTSPEFHLKRSLVLGVEKAFEIRSCFRKEENTPQHAAEFTMLEWYQAFASLDDIRFDVIGLLNYVNEKIEGVLRFDGSVTNQSMAAAFKEHLNFDLTPTSTREDLKKLIIAKGCHFDPSDSWNDLFHRLFIEYVEPKLGLSAPVILFDFPPSQSALARINGRGWADRFEVYFRGFELANAYDELNDPTENLNRFLNWQAEKRELGKAIPPVDDGLIDSLKIGMPPSGGIALGVERLFMAFFGIKDIRDVHVLKRTD